MCLIRVDLPAPLSPTTARTSPAWRSRSTPRSASTGPKLLRRSETCRTGVTTFLPAPDRLLRFLLLFVIYKKPSLIYKMHLQAECQPFFDQFGRVVRRG